VTKKFGDPGFAQCRYVS